MVFSTGTVDDIVERLRDPATARTIAGATGIPEAEVRDNLTNIASRVEAARNNPAQAAAEARQGAQEMFDRARAEGRLEATAERAAQGAATTTWVAFGVLLVTLAMAIWGAMTGRSRAAERLVRANVPTIEGVTRHWVDAPRGAERVDPGPLGPACRSPRSAQACRAAPVVAAPVPEARA